MKVTAVRSSSAQKSLVIAAVRTAHPNAAVIRAAAELANVCDADLLVVGVVRFYIADWSDMPYTDSAVLESCEATLFGHCVELLVGDPVRWSVHVTSEPIASLISTLAGQHRVVGLVLGSRRPGGRLDRVRRRLVGTFASRVRSVHTLVVDGE